MFIRRWLERTRTRGEMVNGPFPPTPPGDTACRVPPAPALLPFPLPYQV